MNHFYGPWCAWTIVTTAAILCCHSHYTECNCTAATFAVSASMVQGEELTSLVAVMITFGTQDTGKLGKRRVAWQPLSVNRCHRDRAKCQSVWCLAACCSLSDSCQHCPRAGEEPRRESDEKCHLWGELPYQGSGWFVYWCIYWKFMHAGTANKISLWNYVT